MAKESDQIRSEIDATRADLASNVDQLADRTNPARIVNRGWHKVTDKMQSVGDRLMGSPSSGSSIPEMAGQAGGRIGDAAAEAADAVRKAPRAAARQTRGNPLAAGMIAFGAGLLAAALIPKSETEGRLSHQLAGSELAEKVSEPLKQSVTELGDDLTRQAKESGSQFADSAKEHVTNAVHEVKDTTQKARLQAAKAQ